MLKEKAFIEFKKKEPISPRKAVYNLLPTNYHSRGRNNTVEHGKGRLLVNKLATNINSIQTYERDRSSIRGSKESLESKK